MVEHQTIVLFGFVAWREQTYAHEQTGQIIDLLLTLDLIEQDLHIDTIVGFLTVHLGDNRRGHGANTGIEPAEIMETLSHPDLLAVIGRDTSIDSIIDGSSILETLRTLSAESLANLTESTGSTDGSERALAFGSHGNVTAMRNDRSTSTAVVGKILPVGTDRVDHRMQTFETEARLRMSLFPSVVSESPVIERFIDRAVADLRSAESVYLTGIEELPTDVGSSTGCIIELVEHSTEGFAVGTMPKDRVEQITRIYWNVTSLIGHLAYVSGEPCSWNKCKRHAVIVIPLKSIEERLEESVRRISHRGMYPYDRNLVCSRV